MSIEIRSIVEADGQWILDLLKEHWASALIVTRGRLHQADRLQGFVAWEHDVRLGALTYNIENDAFEIVTLNSVQEKRGVGRALVKSACQTATDRGCRKVWLITTNDNEPAMRFYEHLGFSLCAVHANAVEVSRLSTGRRQAICRIGRTGSCSRPERR